MDNIEHIGYWWLPENPDNKIAGVLKFSPQSGTRLELIGAFTSGFNSQSDFYPIILGKNADGKLMTLQNCGRTNYNLINFSFEKSVYSVQIVFVGINAEDINALKFNKIRTNLTYLYNWVGVTGIIPDFPLQEGRGEAQFTYLRPKDISIQIDGGRIEFALTTKIKSNYNIASFDEKASIYIECDKERNLFEILNTLITPLQSLINLGTSKTNFIEELILYHQTEPDHGIVVYLPQNFYQSKIKENLFLNEMIFTLSDIYENLEERINDWIILAEKLNSVVNLFTRARISSKMFLELKFLTVAQALETYHRTRRENNFLPRNEHKNKVKEVMQNIPSHHQEWVMAKLGNNEKSLLLRLNELLEERSIVMNPIVESLEEFAKRTRDSRNYYTHYGIEKKKNAAVGESLYWLTEKLLILLESCLMDEIGINPVQQITLFERYEHYNSLKNKKNAQ